jgi:hypothetical protein
MVSIIVYNCSHGDTRWFFSLESYKNYAKGGGYGNGYNVWDDWVYYAEDGISMGDCLLVNIYEFKKSLTNN